MPVHSKQLRVDTQSNIVKLKIQPLTPVQVTAQLHTNLALQESTRAPCKQYIIFLAWFEKHSIIGLEYSNQWMQDISYNFIYIHT